MFERSAELKYIRWSGGRGDQNGYPMSPIFKHGIPTYEIQLWGNKEKFVNPKFKYEL